MPDGTFRVINLSKDAVEGAEPTVSIFERVKANISRLMIEISAVLSNGANIGVIIVPKELIIDPNAHATWGFQTQNLDNLLVGTAYHGGIQINLVNGRVKIYTVQSKAAEGVGPAIEINPGARAAALAVFDNDGTVIGRSDSLVSTRGAAPVGRFAYDADLREVLLANGFLEPPI